jgi:cation diffusion facilitator family transporter
VLHDLDLGVIISSVAGLANYIMGRYMLNYGKRSNSLTMVASGKHLISDTLSSIGLVLGLIIIYFTNILWLDNLLAIIFGGLIFRTGIRLIKVSVTNLLDEADELQLQKLTRILNENRQPNWIDIHNLRVLKYGTFLHVDCHLTLPWYLTLEQSHAEVSAVEKLIKREMGDEIEFFIHADPCLPKSCDLCSVANCSERKSPFVRSVTWNLDNMVPDKKHKL